MENAKYPETGWRQMMKEQEIILRCESKELSWKEGALVLGISERTMRRKKRRYLEGGVSGLFDRRRMCPSKRRISKEVSELYVREYFDYNVSHFHERLIEDHGIEVSYTWVKDFLQRRGYVKKGRRRKVHRIRRERRKKFGEMLHMDGSVHEWMSLCPGKKQVLVLVVDDATGMNLGGSLVEGETTRNCMSVMQSVVENYGIPLELYTDRGSVYWNTLESGGRIDRRNLTHFGKAMSKLGVEMIPGYSPQARGRGERWNGTWQDRLVSELRRAGIRRVEEANHYIRTRFIPDMNRRFTVLAAEKGSAFVETMGADLEQIFCIVHENRVVSKDNTVRVNNLVLQIEKTAHRISFAKCRVSVHEHLDKTYTIFWKKEKLGRYDATGKRLHCFGGSTPQTPRGLAHNGMKDEYKKNKGGATNSAPSIHSTDSGPGSLWKRTPVLWQDEKRTERTKTQISHHTKKTKPDILKCY